MTVHNKQSVGICFAGQYIPNSILSVCKDTCKKDRTEYTETEFITNNLLHIESENKPQSNVFQIF